MRALLICFSILWLALLNAHQAFSSERRFEELFQDFDARGMSVQEKRFLQAALSFQGFYNGLTDGKWGRGSQAAIERYSSDTFSIEPLNVHAATLTLDFVDQVETYGWFMSYQPIFGVSFAFPGNAMKLAKTSDTFRYWKADDGSAELALWKAVPASLARYHLELEAEVAPGSQPYTVRNANLWVTSLVDREGQHRYLRSDRMIGDWSMLAITAAESAKHLLNGVSTSVSLGRAPNFSLPDDGRITSLVALFSDWLDSRDQEPNASVSNQAPVEPEEEDGEGWTSSGSGFYVSASGEVLTNAHVVEGCASVLVDGEPAVIVAASSDFDLALIRTSPPQPPKIVSRFASDTAQLNQDITVVGYPLRGLLGGVNITRGAVTSTKGLFGDLTRMQISAPVQSGNSGGPVLDETGAVVGVVVSKFDAKRYADLAGEIPQNINFAIRGELAKLFLAANQVGYVVGSDAAPLSSVDLARKAQRFTVLIECR